MKKLSRYGPRSYIPIDTIFTGDKAVLYIDGFGVGMNQIKVGQIMTINTGLGDQKYKIYRRDFKRNKIWMKVIE
jgi:hypothetical protein